jgi:phage tail-like protein
VVDTEAQARIDPYGAYNFTVEIDDVAVGFAEVSGLGCEFDYTETDSAESVTSHVTDVTLRRGITGDTAVWSWVHSAMRGKSEGRTVTIRLLDDRHAEVCSWVLGQARLRRWSGPTLNAVTGTLATEEIVLTAQSVEAIAPR